MWRERVLFWWGITRDAVNLWLGSNAFSHAAALAFYTLFSLAPVVIIAVAVIGLVLGEQAAQGQIVGQLRGVMGLEAAQAIEQAVARSRLSEAGWLPSVLGVVALLTGATTVFGQMQVSLNDMWGVAARPDRNSLFMFVKSRILSLTVVLAIGFVLLVSLLMGVVLRAVLHFADQMLEHGELGRDLGPADNCRHRRLRCAKCCVQSLQFCLHRTARIGREEMGKAFGGGMGAVRNETAHADRAASPGRGDEHHLGHALFRHVAQVHPFAHGQPDRLDPGLDLGFHLLVERRILPFLGECKSWLLFGHGGRP